MDKCDYRPLVPLVRVGDYVILNHGGPDDGYGHTWKDSPALVKGLTAAWGCIDLVMIENGEVREIKGVFHSDADSLSAVRRDAWRLPKLETVYKFPPFQKKSIVEPD